MPPPAGLGACQSGKPAMLYSKFQSQIKDHHFPYSTSNSKRRSQLQLPILFLLLLLLLLITINKTKK